MNHAEKHSKNQTKATHALFNSHMIKILPSLCIAWARLRGWMVIDHNCPRGDALCLRLALYSTVYTCTKLYMCIHDTCACIANEHSKTDIHTCTCTARWVQISDREKGEKQWKRKFSMESKKERVKESHVFWYQYNGMGGWAVDKMNQITMMDRWSHTCTWRNRAHVLNKN